tara:strand:+ start:779 stop:1111 length:333 start_codon:yes stop_codon:yes gene_type:complete
MYTKWVEVRNGDYVYFMGKRGQGSVVKTDGYGNFFMPAKTGMRIKGEKYPILKDEGFIMNSSKVQKVEKTERIVKIFLTRLSDGMQFAISETQFQQYFCKKDESNLGTIY